MRANMSWELKELVEPVHFGELMCLSRIVEMSWTAHHYCISMKNILSFCCIPNYCPNCTNLLLVCRREARLLFPQADEWALQFALGRADAGDEGGLLLYHGSRVGAPLRAVSLDRLRGLPATLSGHGLLHRWQW